MGFDTTIIVNNDMLSGIEGDTMFGKMVAEAIRALPGSDGPVPIGHGAYAIESHHMDGITVVAVGGRRGLILGACSLTEDPRDIISALAYKHELRVMTTRLYEELNKTPSLDKLKELADEKGYRLVKNVEPDEPESADETQAIDRILSLEETGGTYEGPDRRKAGVPAPEAAPKTIPLDDEHIGELSEELLREKPKKMSLQEMNEYVKKVYGCRLITLVRKGPATKKRRR